MNRRRFLANAVALGAAPVLTSDLALAADKPVQAPKLTPPLVGSQLYGWGQYYDREGRDLDRNLDVVLSALRDAGYDYAEGTLDVAKPDNTAAFAEKLKKKGLKTVSLYSGGAFHVLGKANETAEKIAVAAKTAAKSGFAIINVNPDPIGRDKTDAELVIQAEALTELGEELRKLGMKLGIHHHTPELRNGAKEFHSNFARCPQDTVGFCYDVHWVYRGGIPPSECLPRYGNRVVSWHLRQSRDQIWWEDLDSGDIDYVAVARVARDQKIPAFYTVELALESGTRITRSVVENHARSRAFVKQVMSA
ncbi:MAG: sugar phosphate isomerase/epimerase [Verrucomicrobiales bacterium]|nr:sugar phosphate isomerase/epimerase [Verrucomicrobiales bacterium]